MGPCCSRLSRTGSSTRRWSGRPAECRRTAGTCSSRSTRACRTGWSWHSHRFRFRSTFGRATVAHGAHRSLPPRQPSIQERERDSELKKPSPVTKTTTRSSHEGRRMIRRWYCSQEWKKQESKQSFMALGRLLASFGFVCDRRGRDHLGNSGIVVALRSRMLTPVVKYSRFRAKRHSRFYSEHFTPKHCDDVRYPALSHASKRRRTQPVEHRTCLDHSKTNAFVPLYHERAISPSRSSAKASKQQFGTSKPSSDPHVLSRRAAPMRPRRGRRSCRCSLQGSPVPLSRAAPLDRQCQVLHFFRSERISARTVLARDGGMFSSHPQPSPSRCRNKGDRPDREASHGQV
jgi:hypothetical protein